MHIYVVKKGAKCKALKQEKDKDIEVLNHVTRFDHEFSDEQLIVDYVRFKNSKAEVKTIADDFASRGYYIFCLKSVNDGYLLAIHSSQVEVQ